MAYNYEYPYVDASQINADWILKEITDMRNFINEKNLVDESKLHSYVEQQLTEKLTAEQARVKKEIDQLRQDVNTKTQEFEQQITKKTDDFMTNQKKQYQEFKEEIENNNSAFETRVNREITKQNEAINNHRNNVRQELDEMQNSLNERKTELDAINKLLNDVKDGKYVDLYLDSIDAYMHMHIQEWVNNIAKYVFFGLSDEGRFVAYIPRSWQFMMFGTITQGDNKGRLVLKW